MFTPDVTGDKVKVPMFNWIASSALPPLTDVIESKAWQSVASQGLDFDVPVGCVKPEASEGGDAGGRRRGPATAGI